VNGKIRISYNKRLVVTQYAVQCVPLNFPLPTAADAGASPRIKPAFAGSLKFFSPPVHFLKIFVETKQGSLFFKPSVLLMKADFLFHCEFPD
jgi:hypothetical protein